MHVDWSGTGSMLGGIGAVVNALLLIWMIAVTIKYVRINADLLRTNQATVRTLEQQIREAQYERTGPVMAVVNDQLRILRRWEAWTVDASDLNAILESKESLRVDAYDAALSQASRISIPLYESLSYAKQELDIFANVIGEIQRDNRAAKAAYRDNSDLYLRRIGNMREFLLEAISSLNSARDRLATIIGPDAVAPPSRTPD